MSFNPLSAVLNIVDTVVDRVVPDKNMAAKIKAAARSEEHQSSFKLLLGQLEINKIEAASKSLFVAGWRPFVGWCCGIGLLYNILLLPFLDIWFEMPEVNTELLERILMGMLGLGVLRTYEKTKGVSREN